MYLMSLDFPNNNEVYGAAIMYSLIVLVGKLRELLSTLNGGILDLILDQCTISLNASPPGVRRGTFDCG